MSKEVHYEIVCVKCDHLVRYHEKGQFACVVEGCDCTKIEPVEREIKNENQEK